MISEGRLDVSPFTGNPFPLKDIEKAFEALNNESIVKAILVPEKG